MNTRKGMFIKIEIPSIRGQFLTLLLVFYQSARTLLLVLYQSALTLLLVP